MIFYKIAHCELFLWNNNSLKDQNHLFYLNVSTLWEEKYLTSLS